MMIGTVELVITRPGKKRLGSRCVLISIKLAFVSFCLLRTMPNFSYGDG